VHPHLFRHFCAWLHLQYHPGDYEGVRRILGHKRIETSIKSYIAFEQDIAAARFDEVVLMERRTTKVMAKQALKIRLCFDNKNTGKSRRDAQNG
jgi:integrase